MKHSPCRTSHTSLPKAALMSQLLVKFSSRTDRVGKSAGFKHSTDKCAVKKWRSYYPTSTFDPSSPKLCLVECTVLPSIPADCRPYYEGEPTANLGGLLDPIA